MYFSVSSYSVIKILLTPRHSRCYKATDIDQIKLRYTSLTDLLEIQREQHKIKLFLLNLSIYLLDGPLNYYLYNTTVGAKSISCFFKNHLTSRKISRDSGKTKS
jgi:hypothetical protein